jgi:hypothetical protein
MMVRMSKSKGYTLSFKEKGVCIYEIRSKHFKEKE